MYISVAPIPQSALGKFIKCFGLLKMIFSLKDSTTQEIGEMIGRGIFNSVVSTVSSSSIGRAAAYAHYRTPDFLSKNGVMGGRSWFHEEIDMFDGRMIKRAVIVYHDANRAGKHIDIHLGHVSLVARVPKSIEAHIRLNRSGELTGDSKGDLMEFVRSELKKHASFAQNIDHTPANARATWLKPTSGAYGSGNTRQIIHESDMEIISIDGQTAKLYAPGIDKHRLLFLHRLSSDGKGAPIVIFGTMKPDSPVFADSLHLSKAENIEEFRRKVDPSTVTIKEDGASTHFAISEKGATFWSPRISKETGERIQYTGKLPELARLVVKSRTTGMGELKFKVKFNLFDPSTWSQRDLSAAEIGGVLNSNTIRPRWLKPSVSVYRIDIASGRRVPMDFHINRGAQESLKLNGMKPVRKVRLDRLNTAGIEGLVGVPKGKTILDGIKIKFWGDTDDWTVVQNGLKFGPKGAIAGTVDFVSMSSGREFKLGPGQLGDHKTCMALMDAGKSIVGRVAKVASKRGHEGRAARFDSWHTDKGVW